MSPIFVKHMGFPWGDISYSMRHLLDERKDRLVGDVFSERHKVHFVIPGHGEVRMQTKGRVVGQGPFS